MARKKIEKAHWTPDESLRALTGWQSDEDKHLRRCDVDIVLDDAAMHETRKQVTEVRASIATARHAVEEANRELKKYTSREETLVNALVSGVLTEVRDVYEYADDEAGVVHQYDPETKQKLAERPMDSWERQHEMDFDADDESDDDAEAGND